MLLKAFLHRTLDVSCGILLCGDVTLIIQFFTLAKPDLDFCSAFLEIDRKGNERKSVLLNRAEKWINLKINRYNTL